MELNEIFQLAVSLNEKEENLNDCCPENATTSNYCFKWNSKELNKQVNDLFSFLFNKNIDLAHMLFLNFIASCLFTSAFCYRQTTM